MSNQEILSVVEEVSQIPETIFDPRGNIRTYIPETGSKYHGWDKIKDWVRYIPAEMTQLKQWVCWNYESNIKGKLAKIPKCPLGGNASSTDHTTWSTFANACKACEQNGYSGIGFVITEGSGITCIDLDGTVDVLGDVHDRLASRLIRDLDGFTEVSPSGNGCHIWIRSSYIPERNAVCDMDYHGDTLKRVEMYAKGRYIAMTGKVLQAPRDRNKLPDRTTEFEQLCKVINEAALAGETRLQGTKANTQPVCKTQVESHVSPGDDKSLLESALAVIPAEEYNLWITIGQALHDWSNGSDEGLALYSRWSSKSPKYQEGDAADKWGTFQVGAGLTAGTIYHEAGRHGWIRPVAKLDIDYVKDTGEQDAITQISAKVYTASACPSPSQGDPWGGIMDTEIIERLAATRIGPLVRDMQSVVEGGLPIRLVLPRALVAASVIASGPQSLTWKSTGVVTDESGYPYQPKGSDLLKFRIAGGAGLATALWGLCGAPTGAGKDIGNVDDRLLEAFTVQVRKDPSAEGLKDFLTKEGRVLVRISELQPYLDGRSWQSKSVPMLTSLYGQYWFDDLLSTRAKDAKPRSSPLAVASIMANIQPSTVRALDARIHAVSGFLPRFFVTCTEADTPFWCLKEVKPKDDTFKQGEHWANMSGIWEPDATIRTALAEGVKKTGWTSRLFAEMPLKILALLAQDCFHPSQEEVQTVHRLCLWSYGQMMTMLGDVEHQDAQANKINDAQKRLLEYCCQERKWRDIRRKFCQSIQVPLIRKLLDDLLGEGMVAHKQDGQADVYSITQDGLTYLHGN